MEVPDPIRPVEVDSHHREVESHNPVADRQEHHIRLAAAGRTLLEAGRIRLAGVDSHLVAEDHLDTLQLALLGVEARRAGRRMGVLADCSHPWNHRTNRCYPRVVSSATDQGSCLHPSFVSSRPPRPRNLVVELAW